ncbi:MAG: nitroreductase family protein [Candidatus Aminicenantales bacterium]
MEFYDVVTRRRTEREFSTAPVAEAIVTRALEAGLKAPSNAHLKYWQFILLRDAERRREAATEYLRARDIKEKTEIETFLGGFEDETLKKIYRRTLPIQLTMMLEAPEVLVVCYKMKPLGECRTLFELNPLASVWMCIENIMLAMAAEGLFGCTYTPYDAGGMKKFLGVPEGFEIASVIPFGYPRNVAEDRDHETLAGRLHIDKW